MVSHSSKRLLVSGSGARTLLSSSILARLPLAMFGIALLVHAQQLTGSFRTAGLVTGAYAACSALSAPRLGRLVDRLGQTRVLIIGALLTAVALALVAALPRSAPPALLVALGGLVGLSTPPLAACVRTLLPVIVSEPERLPRLFAFESTILEFTFILGPSLALELGTIWSTGAALAVGGAIMLAGTLVFAAQPASRQWHPAPQATRSHGGALRSQGMRTLLMLLCGLGAIFGATEVGVTAAARALGATATAGPLLGIWGVGSLVGGVLATRLGGSSRSARGLTALVAALAVTHGALILTAGNLLGIGAILLLAGATIAPTVSGIYAMVEPLAPATARTEAFSWMLTASVAGSSLGAIVGGELAQSGGAKAVFGLVAACGALAAVISALRSGTLEHEQPGRLWSRARAMSFRRCHRLT